MIKFIKGVKQTYLEKFAGENNGGLLGAIFFATDTQEILMDGKPYVGSVVDVETSTDEEGNPILVITKSNGEVINFAGGSKGKYASLIESKDLEMATAYGDFKVGTKVSDLEGKSYDELFDGILFPSINPEHGTPSLTGFALNPSTSPVELGTAVADISAAGLNKATWTEYNNDLAYAGDVTSIEYTLSINGETLKNATGTTTVPSLPENYTTLGNQNYAAKVNYAQGPAPVNNKGVSVPSLACPAGSVRATRTVNVTLPWFASTSAATAENPVVKQSLVSWDTTAGNMSTGNFKVQPSGTLPQVFKLPREMKSLQMLNTVSGKMEATSTSVFTKTTETISINGIDRTYYVYTYNGADRGEVQLLAKF